MVVMEKRKDVAVLMAMGATPTEIRRVFTIKGLIVGGAGTLAGLVFGAIGCVVLERYHFIHISREVYGISSVPIAVDPLSFVMGRDRLDGVVPAGDDLSGSASLARTAGRDFPVLTAFVNHSAFEEGRNHFSISDVVRRDFEQVAIEHDQIGGFSYCE